MTSDHELDRIVTDCSEILGLTEADQLQFLREELLDLKQFIPFFETRNTIRRPADVRDILTRLIKAAKREEAPDRLRSILDKSEQAFHLIRWQCALRIDPDWPEGVLQNGLPESVLEGAFATPAVLADLANKALNTISPKVKEGRGGNRRKEDWAKDQAILLIGVLFQELTGEKPGISVDPVENAPTGRFLALARCCLHWLGYKDSYEAIRARFRKVREQEGW